MPNEDTEDFKGSRNVADHEHFIGRMILIFSGTILVNARYEALRTRGLLFHGRINLVNGRVNLVN